MTCCRRLPPVALALVLVVYALVCLDALDRLPTVHSDEAWNAAPAWKLATTGVYGSDLFTGVHRGERRTYQFMPVLQLLLAADFALFGVGVLQIRLLSVLVGAVVLVLTYAVGTRVGGTRVGLVAVWTLAFHRLASGNLDTGIVLLDLVRQTRYHIVAAAFGLAALLVFLRAEGDQQQTPSATPGCRPGNRRHYVLCGVVAGLAYLSHVYGAFWLAAFAAVLAARRPLRGVVAPLAAIGAGFLVVVLPWALYVLGDLSAYAGQMRMYGERFALLDPWFYVTNVVNEPRRYGPFGNRDLGAIGAGSWIALFALVFAMGRGVLVALTRPRDAISAVVISLLVISGLYALLLKWKTFSYLLTTLPLAAIVTADGIWTMADRLRPRVAAALAAVVLVLSAGESTAALRDRHQRALRTTPYDDVVRQIAAHVPRDATVLIPQRFWIGLRDRQVRSWLAPLFMADPISTDAPIPLDEALARVNPDVIVLDDQEFGAYFERLASPDEERHHLYQELQRFMRTRDVHAVAQVRDDTYGHIVIYAVNAGRPR